jgi:hypothetical protein
VADARTDLAPFVAPFVADWVATQPDVHYRAVSGTLLLAGTTRYVARAVALATTFGG